MLKSVITLNYWIQDNDIDLNLLDVPLLYLFATKEYIVGLQEQKVDVEDASCYRGRGRGRGRGRRGRGRERGRRKN